MHGPCTGEDVGKVVLQVSFGAVRITGLDFPDDAVIFAVTEVLAEELESLSKEAKALRMRASWMNSMVQAFGVILDATIELIIVM